MRIRIRHENPRKTWNCKALRLKAQVAGAEPDALSCPGRLELLPEGAAPKPMARTVAKWTFVSARGPAAALFL